MPPPISLVDFAAWFEAWIGDGWHIFDSRNNVPHAGRVLMARGRDACDVAIATTFGPNTLESFRVWTDEIPDGEIPKTADSFEEAAEATSPSSAKSASP